MAHRPGRPRRVSVLLLCRSSPRAGCSIAFTRRADATLLIDRTGPLRIPLCTSPCRQPSSLQAPSNPTQLLPHSTLQLSARTTFTRSRERCVLASRIWHRSGPGTEPTNPQDTAPRPFAPLNCTIRNVHKTGLGSSAAMVTSLTSSLFLHWTAGASSADTETALSEAPTSSRLPGPDAATTQLLHNLAQYVHSLAQGKIGSGFDVSAAVYGSQTYRRFAVECLSDLLDRGSSPVSQARGTCIGC